MRIARPAFCVLLASVGLSSLGVAARGQEPPLGQVPTPPDERPTVPPDVQQQLDELLALTLPQQKQRAEELIREYPGTELARTLRRLLNEYAAFNALAEQERQAREARTAWGRAYWQSRCCPLPAWNPPVGSIVNETGEPVLYEQRIEGIHHTRWSGPYRLRRGAAYSSPHPYLVRYLVGGALRSAVIVPGDVYAFRGSPADGTLELVPSAGPVPPAGEVTVPAPAAPTPQEPSPDDGVPMTDGPMMLP
ncbi:MAG TPA: hypothetical protein VF170_13105 [Planctomycetaceae bacterium]